MNLSKKKTLELLVYALIVALVLGGSLPVNPVLASDPVATTQASSDLAGHWAEKQISNWNAQGIIKGYEDRSFKPDKEITRAEFVTLINKTFGFAKKSAISFSDVNFGDWYYDEISKAKAAGYLSGYGDGTIKPNNRITRQEVALIFYQLLKLQDTGTMLVLNQFTDEDSIPAWSRSAVATLVSGKYMSGYPDGSYQPTRPTTRAEAAALLSKTVGVLLNTPGTYGPAEGTETIAGNLMVAAAGIKLRNMTITGNLYLTAGIGEGNVELDNIKIEGTTVVSGGGENSIIFQDSTIGQLIVDKEGGKIRIVAQGNTNVTIVRLESGARLEEQSVTGDGFGNVTVYVTAEEEVELAGNFGTVSLHTPGSNVALTAGTIGTLQVTQGAQDAQVDLADGTSVTTLETNTAANITGKGMIGTAKIVANGVRIEQRPTIIEIAKGITAIIAGETRTGSNYNYNGGGEGSSKITITNIIIATPPAKVTYLAGEVLDLSGLVVKLIKSDESIEEIGFGDFAGKGIKTNLTNGKILLIDDTAITIIHIESGKNVAQPITVNLPVFKAALLNAIDAANTNKGTAIVSTDGSEVDSANKWVTQEEMIIYEAAISAAQTVVEKIDATQEEVDDAVTALGTATDTFNTAKKAGTRTTLFKITFNVTGINGSLVAKVDDLSINTGDTVEAGKDVVFTATPAENYRVKAWKVNGVVAEGNTTNTLKVENLAAAIGVTVEFEPLKALSSDATLSNLTVNGITVEGFSPDTLTYHLELPAGTTAIPTVTATVTDIGKASAVITGATELPGATTVLVTAEDGITTKTYTINFTVQPRADNLTGLTMIRYSNGSGSTVTLIPGFAGNIYTYTATVENSMSGVKIIPTPVEGNTVEVKLGNTSKPEGKVDGLVVGDNTISVIVKKEGCADLTYTITLTREALIYITAIEDISGIAKVGETLTAGALTPVDATVNYQWQRADTAEGSYKAITGATNKTYKLVSADVGKFIRVQVTGSGKYTGVLESEATAAVVPAI